MSTSSTTEPHQPQLIVGRIIRPHGLRGDVDVAFTSARPERTAPGSRMWANGRLLVVRSAKQQSNQKATWLVHFDDINDRNSAQQISKMDLLGDPIEDSSVLWVHELVGSQVIGVGGEMFGNCVAVINNPAHAILELDTGVLVPIVFIVERIKGQIQVDVPAGLIDLNKDGT